MATDQYRAALTAGSPRNDAIAWALAASVALHAGLLGATFGAGRGSNERAVAPASTLTAVLQPAPPEPLVLAAISPVALPITPTLKVEPALRLTPDAPVPARASASTRDAAGSRNMGLARIAAELLGDRSRVGDLWSRQMSEFPIEVDRTVRIADRIVARYPEGALAAGREDTVVAWIVVDEQGAAAEIEIAEGAEDFADAAREAIKATRFVPARDRNRPIRFPIALEFRFRLGGPEATTAAAK